MTATGLAAPFSTPASAMAKLHEDPADLEKALKAKFRTSHFDSDALKEYLQEHPDPYIQLVTDEEAVKTLQQNLQSEQELEVSGHPSTLANSNNNIVYAFPGKGMLNFLTPAAWKKAPADPNPTNIPRAHSAGHKRNDKFLDGEARFGKLAKRLTRKNAGYKRASQYSELGELANAVPAPHLTPASLLEQLAEEEQPQENFALGLPPRTLRSLSTGSVQSLPYFAKNHPALVVANPDFPSSPISPAESLLPRLNVPSTIKEEPSTSSSSSPTSVHSSELRTPEKLTLVLLPEEPRFVGFEPVEQTLGRKNSAARRSLWDGPPARGPKKPKNSRTSQSHTSSPLRASPAKLSPTSSSDGEDNYSPQPHSMPLMSPMVPAGALLSHMGYSVTPPMQDARPLGQPQVYSPYRPSPASKHIRPAYTPSVVPGAFHPQHFSPHLSSPGTLTGTPFIPPTGLASFPSPFPPPVGFVPQMFTPLPPSSATMMSGALGTVPLPQSPWLPTSTPYGRPMGTRY